mmetsp:Transcript_21343/g.65114  ORF Transcript_21343/g.65114 Transcript_21343/m.65114 type:complete len:504 (+) Transcript_21343:4552-6063(+)
MPNPDPLNLSLSQSLRLPLSLSLLVAELLLLPAGVVLGQRVDRGERLVIARLALDLSLLLALQLVELLVLLLEALGHRLELLDVERRAAAGELLERRQVLARLGLLQERQAPRQHEVDVFGVLLGESEGCAPAVHVHLHFHRAVDAPARDKVTLGLGELLQQEVVGLRVGVPRGGAIGALFLHRVRFRQRPRHAEGSRRRAQGHVLIAGRRVDAAVLRGHRRAHERLEVHGLGARRLHLGVLHRLPRLLRLPLRRRRRRRGRWGVVFLLGRPQDRGPRLTPLEGVEGGLLAPLRRRLPAERRRGAEAQDAVGAAAGAAGPALGRAALAVPRLEDGVDVLDVVALVDAEHAALLALHLRAALLLGVDDGAPPREAVGHLRLRHVDGLLRVLDVLELGGAGAAEGVRLLGPGDGRLGGGERSVELDEVELERLQLLVHGVDHALVTGAAHLDAAAFGDAHDVGGLVDVLRRQVLDALGDALALLRADAPGVVVVRDLLELAVLGR